MVRPELVRRKLSHLVGYLDELEAQRNVSLEGYRAPGGTRRAVERLLQLIIEAAVDINVHAVTELHGIPPPDYRSSFREAAKAGLITEELGRSLEPAADLRNVLVHDYGDIDDALVHASIPQALEDFREHAREVLRWLEERPTDL
jgi:uncharacterized protein YutE (UPF0331/DUF86 family)